MTEQTEHAPELVTLAKGKYRAQARSCDKGEINQLKARGFRVVDAPPADESEGYEAFTKPDLEAEVDRRNATRDPDGERYIVVAGKGNKPDLVAALEADDALEAGQ